VTFAEQLGRGFTVAIILGALLFALVDWALRRRARRRIDRELLLERYRQLQEP
jgi:hypothetical protein